MNSDLQIVQLLYGRKDLSGSKQNKKCILFLILDVGMKGEGEKLLQTSLKDGDLIYRILIKPMVKSQTALGSKSHLGSFAQVLGQHDEVDQCLRVAAVLIGIRERKTLYCQQV